MFSKATKIQCYYSEVQEVFALQVLLRLGSSWKQLTKVICQFLPSRSFEPVRHAPRQAWEAAALGQWWRQLRVLSRVGRNRPNPGASWSIRGPFGVTMIVYLSLGYHQI